MQKKYNKKSKKLVAVVLVMMFCLSGCSQNDVSSEITSSVQNETVTEKEEVSLSPKDMTVEEMLKHIKLYGEEVSLPCKVSELPKTVTLGDGYTLSDGGAVCDLLHNGEKIGSAHFYQMKSNEFKEINMSSGYEDEVINCLSIDEYDCFDIVGITLNDTKESIIAQIGEPLYQTDEYIGYGGSNDNRESAISFYFYSNGKMYSSMWSIKLD